MSIPGKQKNFKTITRSHFGPDEKHRNRMRNSKYVVIVLQVDHGMQSQAKRKNWQPRGNKKSFEKNSGSSENDVNHKKIELGTVKNQ